MTGTALVAKGVVKRYAGVHAVDGVDITAEPGRVAALIGPNGAGKTTLFHCLSGVEIPDEGTVYLGDSDVTRLGSDARSRLGLARTFQHSSVFPSLTVAENLFVGADNRRRDGIIGGLLGLADRHHSANARIVAETMDRLGLSAYRDDTAATLSTGCLRLVELGRALCTKPAVLLLDEPASGLDDDETGALHVVLRSLASDGLALLLVEHDLGLVRETADVVHVMAAGRIVASGPPVQLAADAGVQAIVTGGRA